MEEFDVVIIGGGPGGYVAAIRAAQLGAKVALVERDRLGGICLNKGCIPTKALLYSAEVFSLARRSSSFGVSCENPRLDFPAMVQRKDEIVAAMVDNVALLMESNGVEVWPGVGRLVDEHTVEVKGQGVTEWLRTRNIILATGSSPAHLPLPGVEASDVLYSDDALSLPELPPSLLIVGGGAIGVELATLFNELGADVTLVEILPRLIPGQDEEIAAALQWLLTEAGIAVHTETELMHLEGGANGKRAILEGVGGQQQLEVAAVVLALGRVPNTRGVGLEKVGVRHSQRGIAVNERLQTNVPHIYAVGDVTGGAMLAHVASAEGKAAAENALGLATAFDRKVIPHCIFTKPEIASVGLTEREAREGGHPILVGKFPLNANGRAWTIDQRDGFVKIVAGAQYEEVLGVHIFGPHASELILEGAMAIAAEATLYEFGKIVHPHPTLSEAMAEAILSIGGESLHLPSRKRSQPPHDPY